jgi:hypothetical protein
VKPSTTAAHRLPLSRSSLSRAGAGACARSLSLSLSLSLSFSLSSSLSVARAALSRSRSRSLTSTTHTAGSTRTLRGLRLTTWFSPPYKMNRALPALSCGQGWPPSTAGTHPPTGSENRPATRRQSLWSHRLCTSKTQITNQISAAPEFDVFCTQHLDAGVPTKTRLLKSSMKKFVPHFIYDWLLL